MKFITMCLHIHNCILIYGIFFCPDFHSLKLPHFLGNKVANILAMVTGATSPLL